MMQTLPDECTVRICSFLSAKDLGRLGQATRRLAFGASEVGSCAEQPLTIIEEGARAAAAARVMMPPGATAEEAAAPDKPAGESWLRRLWFLENPLCFTTAGPELVIGADGTAVSWPERREGVQTSPEGVGWQAAVCDENPIVAGKHFAEFTLQAEGKDGITLVGVIGPGVDTETALRTGGGRPLCSSADAWLIAIGSGFLFHHGSTSNWPGQPQRSHGRNVVRPGDRLGLLVDVELGTLAVYVNGYRQGSMVTGPDMRIWSEDESEQLPVQPLKPPLRWAASVGYRYSLRIARHVPPLVTAAERVADEQQEREWRERSLATSSSSDEDDQQWVPAASECARDGPQTLVA